MVGDLHESDEGEGGFESSWSITEAEDEATRAWQYKLDFDMGLLDDD